jgi:hypothetical protein
MASSYRGEKNDKSRDWQVRKYPPFWLCSNVIGKISIPGNLVTGSFSGLLSNMRKKVLKFQFETKQLQAWTGPEVSRGLRLPRFQDNWHLKVVRLSALRTGRL